LSLPLTLQDLRPLAPLSGHLTVHGFDDAVGGVDVADLVAQAHDAPFAGGFVDCFGDVGVEGGALA